MTAPYRCSRCDAPIVDPLDLSHVCPDTRAAWRAKRIAAGLCAVDMDGFRGWCVTHGVWADLGHDLAVHGTTNPDGTARNE